VLATRLDHAPFEKWVSDELNGYPKGTPVPDYRRAGGISSIGSFAGPMGAQINNVPLALGHIPEDLRERYLRVEFREGIAVLEDMVSQGEGEIVSRWPGDLIAKIGRKFIQGYTLMAAHMEIPRNAVVAVLDAVRNRTLQFALEIERQAPGAGDVAIGAKPLPEERVSQIFNTIILGDAQTVAIGTGITQQVQQLRPGSLDDLKRFFAGQGVSGPDLVELERALASEPAPEPGQPFGRRVATWVGTMIGKASSGAWKIATSTATEIVTAALKKYYGLD
jgi:hypothetical protein